MKKNLTIFLQAVVVALCIGAFVFLLWEPWIEGVNAHATTLYEIYGDDPFLVYAYTASIFFFVALYQAFLLLGHVRQGKVYSPDSVMALRTIQYCAMIIIGFIVPPVAYLLVVRPGDDIAGGVAIGLFLTTLSTIVAIVAKALRGKLQNTILQK